MHVYIRVDVSRVSTAVCPVSAQCKIVCSQHDCKRRSGRKMLAQWSDSGDLNVNRHYTSGMSVKSTYL